MIATTLSRLQHLNLTGNELTGVNCKSLHKIFQICALSSVSPRLFQLTSCHFHQIKGGQGHLLDTFLLSKFTVAVCFHSCSRSNTSVNRASVCTDRAVSRRKSTDRFHCQHQCKICRFLPRDGSAETRPAFCCFP